MTSADAAARGGFAALDPCVHCGFCLPACPTYLATGDENDSPRGRIVLMRALEAGELPATDPAVRHHLDACLGCRGCEPACPSGVGYGAALETARAVLARANGLPWRVAGILAVFRRVYLWRPVLTLLRWFQLTSLPARLAGWGRIGFGMGMLGPVPGAGFRVSTDSATAHRSEAPTPGTRHPAPARLALFRGCVTDTLLREVNNDAVAVLRACGHEVVEVPGQSCCGALHAHAGALQEARDMVAANAAAFDLARVDTVVLTSAGCGAHLRGCHHLQGDARAAGLASRVRDVTEVLAEGPLPPMRALDLDIAYDPPCHLQHAQSVHDAPIALLRSIPGVRMHLLPGHDRCCGGAGIYGILHPELSRQVLETKLEAIRQADPPIQALVSGNPGCMMQLGAGLRASGMAVPVLHPVQLVREAMEGSSER